MGDLEFKVIEKLVSVKGDYGKTIEVNYGEWNNNGAKYDIRAWKSDGKGKGFTLDYDELYLLYSQLHEYYKKRFYFAVDDTYNEKSILNIYGYNVNAQEDKSELERRAVLDMIIKNGIMSKERVISFLQYLIDRPSGKRNMSQSIRKWRSDIEYLSGKKTQIKAKNIVFDDNLLSQIRDDMPF